MEDKFNKLDPLNIDQMDEFFSALEAEEIEY
jgi:hypothetical protein